MKKLHCIRPLFYLINNPVLLENILYCLISVKDKVKVNNHYIYSNVYLINSLMLCKERITTKN